MHTARPRSTTEEGNYDLVGSNAPVFFIRDPSKFSDFIHSQKRMGADGLRSNNAQWDFWSLQPAAYHVDSSDWTLTWRRQVLLDSDRGPNWPPSARPQSPNSSSPASAPSARDLGLWSDLKRFKI